MHKATPLMSSFRAYVAGGCRATIKSVDDSKLMQESSGGFMAGESRSSVESPQNYGFTSVTMDADDAGGSGGGSSGGGAGGAGGGVNCPETFVSFMGGNRSFPVMGNIDDRRHRLKGLDKGDVAMFRTKQDSQQFHMTTDGGFWSAPTNKTVRMALVQQQQQGGGQGGSGGSSGGSSGSGSSGGGQQHGQQSVKKQNQDSKQFVDITQNETRMSGPAVRAYNNGTAYLSVANGNCYVGGTGSDGAYAPVVTTQGPCRNVPGKYG